VAEEHPELWGALIDLDPSMSADASADQLVQDLGDGLASEDRAIRAGQRFGLRLLPRAMALIPSAFRADGSYLVTGGLGHLGLLVAEWMVRRGARRVVLLGRTGLPARATWSDVQPDSTLGQRIAGVRALEHLGASVHVAAVDVADADAVAAFVDTFRREGWPAIRGVIHAAGVASNQLLSNTDQATFLGPLGAKVVGTWALHDLLGRELDFFVLFSSIAALLPQAGQANYAAANAFLDALATHRRAQGLVASSIQWGLWAGSSFGEEAQWERAVAQMAEQGIYGFESEIGLEALGRLLDAQAPAQSLFARVDWDQLTRVRAHARPLSHALPGGSQAAPIRAATATGPAELPEQLRNTPIAERRGLLEHRVQSEVALVLRLPQSAVGAATPLGELGLDSLIAVELRDRLARLSGLQLSATLAWSFPTVAELAAHLAERLDISLEADLLEHAPRPMLEEPTVARPTDTLLAGVASLTDDEALAALLGRRSEVAP
jgi:myxalamid-type polyketide synthase MxaE and MxaD